jgi:nitrous oxide reductase
VENIKWLLVVVPTILVCSFLCVNGVGTTKTLQSLHREIGNKLIKIKKANPQSQTLVYSILDQLGRYHSVSKRLVEKKRKYKKLFKKERKSGSELKRKVTKMEEKVEKMKKVIIEVSDRLKKDFTPVGELKVQKEKFFKEKEQLVQDKNLLTVERDSLVRERDALVRERDALAREKDILEKKGVARGMMATAG